MSINPVLIPAAIPPLDERFKWVVQDIGDKCMRHNVAKYIDGEWVTMCGSVIKVAIWLDDEKMFASCED